MFVVIVHIDKHPDIVKESGRFKQQADLKVQVVEISGLIKQLHGELCSDHTVLFIEHVLSPYLKGGGEHLIAVRMFLFAIEPFSTIISPWR